MGRPMSEQSLRKNYDHQLKQLHQEVTGLGIMVDKAVRKSLAALRSRDIVTAEEICDEDQWINEKRF